MYKQGWERNTPLAPVSAYALCASKSGSENSRHSRLLDLVHAHLITSKSSFCSSGCLVLAQISRREFSLPPLPTHITLMGIVGRVFHCHPWLRSSIARCCWTEICAAALHNSCGGQQMFFGSLPTNAISGVPLSTTTLWKSGGYHHCVVS